ncbi:hypothetical protein H8356DRAFT_1348359 [Neocallimastix lanati (nom. inval.)]|nr:hypothetical protein H8356DRAFT_1348359 [Neocallimastix sp. JGI-2020a]
MIKYDNSNSDSELDIKFSFCNSINNINPNNCKFLLYFGVINRKENPHQNYLLTLHRSQSSLHTTRRCLPNVPTYISIDHEHLNGIINSSLVGVIIGGWKYYNHQGLCFNSKRSISVGNLIRLFDAIPRIRTPPSTVTCIVLTDWTNMTMRI